MTLSSPFDELHKKLKAAYSKYHNWNLPSDYGDVKSEISAANNSCAIFDLSAFGRIEITGAQRDSFIDFVCPQSIQNVNGQVESAFICCPQGSIVDIVKIAKTNKYTYILTTPPKREQILKLLEQASQIRQFDVQINDKTTSTAMIGFYGPKAFEIISKKLPVDMSDLESQQIKEVSMFVFSATLFRSSWLGLDGIELICNSSLSSMATFAIGKMQDNDNLKPAGMDSLNSLFIESSLPCHIDCRAEKVKLYPQTFNLTKKMDFNKDFISKTALENLDSSKVYTAVGLKAKSINKVQKNLTIQYDDRQIGYCDLLINSDRFGCAIGIGYIESSFSALEDEVQLLCPDFVAGAEICHLPFDNNVVGGIYR